MSIQNPKNDFSTYVMKLFPVLQNECFYGGSTKGKRRHSRMTWNCLSFFKRSCTYNVNDTQHVSVIRSEHEESLDTYLVLNSFFLLKPFFSNLQLGTFVVEDLFISPSSCCPPNHLNEFCRRQPHHWKHYLSGTVDFTITTKVKQLVT